MKYLIKARIEVEGAVERPDIIGAIFGQTEGLFGEEYDLRELQDKGRIGRIQVNMRVQSGKTIGEIEIPSNLDRVETAIIAAMVEVVDRVGPYPARTKIVEVLDLREEKAKKIAERAREILEKMLRERKIDVKELIDDVVKAVRAAEMIKYGPEKLPAGPDVDRSDTIIIVEGRADVMNMLKYGYKNVIALEGASSKIPETIVKLSKEKMAIAFLDGDHGGDLILKELLRVAEIDYVARAPHGKEVEELTGKEIAKCLKNAVPIEQLVGGREERQVETKKTQIISQSKIREKIALEIPSHIVEKIKELQGSLRGVLYDKDWNPIDEVQVKDLVEKVASLDEVYAIVFDGIVSQRLIDVSVGKGVKLLIGARIGGISKRPTELKIASFEDLL